MREGGREGERKKKSQDRGKKTEWRNLSENMRKKGETNNEQIMRVG